MASLFFLYLICLLLILMNKRNTAFTLIAISLIFSLVLFLHHTTEIIKIRL